MSAGTTTNTHAAMIRAAGGLWKGGTPTASQQQQLQAVSQHAGDSAQARIIQTLGTRFGLNPQPAQDDGVMSAADFQSELYKIQHLNLSAPPPPTPVADYSAGLTPAPLAAQHVPVGGSVSGV